MFTHALTFSQNGDHFFSYPAVHAVDIRFELTNYWDSLTIYKTNGDETGLEKFIKADVIIDGDTVPDVGIRFRGNASYGHPGTKKPLQLDFNEFVSGQKYDGLKKLNLNNNHMDPTQLREKLYLDILNELHLTAPRCAYAAVSFNGTYIGLYNAVETINKDFLEKFFTDDTGNLYKCEPNTPLTYEGNNQEAYYDNAELKTNEAANDWSGLIDFIHEVNTTPAENYETVVGARFNLDSYLKQWAANVVFGNLDSYVYLAHNYYLYDNPTTGKFEWITWDVSLSFGVYAPLLTPNSIDFSVEYLPNNAQTDRPLNYYCLQSETLRKKYLSEICNLVKTKFSSAYLDPRIDSIAPVIRPFIAAEPPENAEFTMGDVDANYGFGKVNFSVIGVIPGMKDYVATRQSNITKELCNLKWSCAAGDFVEFEDGLSFYPNPGTVFNARFNIPAEYTSTQFTLFDIRGKKVFDASVKNNAEGLLTIDLGHLENGVYIMKSDAGCFPVQHKLVVSH